MKYQKVYIEEYEKNGEPISKWDILREKEKKKFFSYWDFVQFFCHVLQIFDAILSLYEGVDIVVYTQYVTGFAACLSYIILGKYLLLLLLFKS